MTVAGGVVIGVHGGFGVALRIDRDTANASDP